MRARIGLVLALILTAHLLGTAVRAQTTLAVTSAGPNGETASLEQAAEIRVQFSEPMVALGRIPDEVAAPFFAIRPAVKGTFRWAGPTTLVFTPDPAVRLPYATRYDVTIDASATAVSGRTLGQPFRFSFTTPTVRLLRTDWYREKGRFDQPAIIALRFNQPVRPADILAHATLRYTPHQWGAPIVPAQARARMGADALAALERKVAETAAVAGSTAPMPIVLATEWDRKRFPPASTLVVLRTDGAPKPDGWLRVMLDNRVPALQGRETPPAPQTFVVQLQRTFFIDSFDCVLQCDADRYNGITARVAIDVVQLRRAVKAVDLTDPGKETPVAPAAGGARPRDEVTRFTLEDAGFARQPPARTYAVTIDAALQAHDGQTLGYTWAGIVENWHERAFTSFGDGHGVWEAGGGALPFYSRNFADATQWAAPLAPAALMPTLRELERRHFRAAPPGAGAHRTLRVTPDKIESQGLDLSRAISPAGTGLVWTAVQPGRPIPQARTFGDNGLTASVVQVTNLGITVKDSPLSTLVFVTRLDNGTPVAGAAISIVRLDNTTFWTGKTDGSGVAMAPGITCRNPRNWWQFAFLVTAQKDGDVAYVGSDWNEGIAPFMFGAPYDLSESKALLRGTVFSDRGVYKLGEEVHFKGVLRHDTPAAGIQLLPPGTPVFVALHDSRGRTVDRRTLTVGGWSSVEWTSTLPADGALGDYQVLAALDQKALEENRAPRPPEQEEEGAWQSPWRATVRGSFLVAAYRRPDFRVDATLAGDPSVAGATLKAVVSARYLFGAPMAKRPVAWTFSRSPWFQPPPAITNKYPAERFAFVGCCDDAPMAPPGPLASKTATLDAAGQLVLDLTTTKSDGLPHQYTFEGDVEDVSRQRIAGRAMTVVHPAAFYVGLQRPSLFVEQKNGLDTAVVAATPAGVAVPGVAVDVTLVEVQWHSVRRAEGNGFYTWESQRKEVEAGHFAVTTGADPTPLHVPLKAGGSFLLKATAKDADGRLTTTRLSFYSLGTGYTAWARYDHNRIDIIPERQTYKPGETARLMIQSPWEKATALLTVEREGIRSHTPFELTSTQQTVTVPITAADIPNLYVSVLLVKGRTRADVPDDGSDPGKPSFRLGYASLAVEDSSKRLSVAVKADHDEFRPAGTAKVDVRVIDAKGLPAAGEVTLWAVDYGVLSLTGYHTPDVLGSVYVRKALQVMSLDSRQRIVSRRVLTPKGEEDGGGGGVDEGGSTLRKDFRVLAFWLGSVTTDARGHASVDVKLPESLTTYRIMAVSGDRESRFGSGESEIRINKPVVLKAAFPRFMALGDRAFFGSVVTSQLKQAGAAVVTMRSLDPAILQVEGDGRRVVQVGAGGSTEVRFNVVARALGRARVQTTVKIGSESDAFEDVVPVRYLASPQSVAAYGEADPDAKQALTMPAGVVPGFGGLHLELASTALVGLGEGAQYLVDYPYGCVEQRASRAFALALAADLGDAFHLQGIDPKDLRGRVQTSLNELEKFQCPSGGFAFWPGDCRSVSPYLTAYVLHVYQAAVELKYDVNRAMLERAYTYLGRVLAEKPPANASWWPAYTAWQTFAVKVLAEGGRNQDSNISRLYGALDRMPVFALAYLRDAMAARGETGARPAELRRRIANAMLPEAGSLHVEELNDPYLMWFWNSNVRSTSVVLDTLVREGDSSADVSPIVRWLMSARRDGRWGNTQENAWAMQALVHYYRKYESRPPDFTALVRLGADELARQAFKGRSTQPVSRDVGMAQLAQKVPPGSTRDLTVRREGEGALFYSARLTYAPDASDLAAVDNGFRIRREYQLLADGKPAAPGDSFEAGDLVRVTIGLDLPKERRFVAVTDPLPAGFEPVESWFATTAADLTRSLGGEGDEDDEGDWQRWWRRGTFDHVERHDDRVLLFATRLADGHHEFTYVVRATTAGRFRVAPPRAEEMYAPEISGRGATRVVEVKP